MTIAEELRDEIVSINAIYGDGTLQELDVDSAIFILQLPSRPDVSLRVQFPADYPDAPPAILGTQSVSGSTAKGEGALVAESVREIVAEVYSPGVPCIFDLIEDCTQKLQHHDTSDGPGEETKQAVAGIGQHQQNSGKQEPPGADAQQSSQPPPDGVVPPWSISEVITEKKSIFVARAAPVQSVDQARSYLAHLLASDKKIAKATHNITAWRIRGEGGVQYQDCDDDGETAAGGRLLHLLELMSVWDMMVVVTRWYGGIHLGPDRFRLINQAARDAIVKCNPIQMNDKDAYSKKKGKT